MKGTKFLFYLFIILLSSCIRPLDLQVAREVKPCAACIISNYDTTVKIAVFWGKEPGDTSAFIPIDNANIKLYEADNEIGELNFTSFSSQNGLLEKFYALDYRPLAGKIYSFNANIPGYGSISGHTVIPVPAHVEYKYFDTVYLPDESGQLSRYVTFHLTVYDADLSHINHYAIGLSASGFDLKEIKGPNLFFEYDDRHSNRLIIFSDEQAKDGKINLEVTGKNIPWVEDFYSYNILYDTLVIKFFIYTLSQDAYWTLLPYNFNQMNDFNDLPIEFLREPISAYSNIKNGYGYFAGIAVDTTQTLRISFK